MNITSYDVAYIFATLFYVYSVKLFYDTFFKVKKEFKFLAAAGYITYFVFTVLFHFIDVIPIAYLIENITLLMFIALCYDASLRKKITAVIECYLIMFIVEAVTIVITTNTGFSIFHKYEYENIIGLFVDRMVTFFIIFLVNKLYDFKNKKDLPLWLYFSFLPVPVITIVIEIMLCCVKGVTANVMVISIILMFTINIAVFFAFNSLSVFYERSLNNVRSEQEREYYYNQCLLMQKSTEDLRAFQHDISNHFMVIENLLKNGKGSETLEYVSQLTEKETNMSDIYSCTGNIAVDSIINYKLCGAKANNISISTDIIIPKELPIEITDLSVILTNLIDNALQALEKLEENKELDIKVKYQKGMLMLRICNTFNGTVKYENGELLTTKNEASQHGYGMKNVESIVQKYDGVCRFKHDRSVFQTEILLYAE